MRARLAGLLAGLAVLAPSAHSFTRAASTSALRALSCDACSCGSAGCAGSSSAGSSSSAGLEGLELRERPRWRPPAAYMPASDVEVKRLTGMLERLCNIIISADDVALAEREAGKMGRVFLDARGNMTRSPVLLRQETRELMLEYGVAPRPVPRKWQLQRRGE
jgi:hypothetical protein